MGRTVAGSEGTITASGQSSTGDVGGRSGTPGVANSEPATNQAPEAVVTGPDEGEVNEALMFSAEDSTDADGDDLTFSWDFDDDTSATGSEVTHTYTSAGSYTVRLTVSDGDLEDTASLAVSVTKPSYSDNIVINEFLPNPSGSDSENEFIELRNQSSEAIDLSSWQLDDKADGGSSPYTIPVGTSISGKGIKAFSRSDTKIALNNSGDSVRLIDPNGDEKTKASYDETVPDGYSYNRDDSEYVLSTTVTKGAKNVITKPVDEDEDQEADDEDAASGSVASATATSLALKDVRDLELGTMITTTGVVSVPPGVFGERMMYLSGSGMQIYFSKGSWPNLKLGDTVRLTGELSSVSGEARLKLAQVGDSAATASGEPPTAQSIETGNVDEAMEGSLVTVSGLVSQTSGDTFYIDDGSGEAKVYIKSTTGIEKPPMKRGVFVTVTGIVSETASGYRVLPRFQSDVRLGQVAGLTRFPNTGLRPGFSLQAGLLLLPVTLLWLGYRAKEPLLFDL